MTKPNVTFLQRHYALVALWLVLIAALTIFLTPSRVVAGSDEATKNVTRISGSGFTEVTRVLFNGEPVDFQVKNDNEIMAFPKAAASGAVDVLVETPAGVSTFQMQLGSKPPVRETPINISSIDPPSGPMSGGTTVQLRGSGFMDKAPFQVYFGDTPSPDVTVNSDSVITAVSPSHDPGSAKVSVKVGGEQSFSLTPFYFVPAPAVTAVEPGAGPVAGASPVKIRGSNFSTSGVVQVHFGTNHSRTVQVKSDTEIEALTPPSVSGSVEVRVTNPDGQTGFIKNGYRFVSPPTIRSVLPMAD